MINEKLREEIKERLEETCFLENPSFDYSIIGCAEDGKLVYDFEKMIEEYAEEENCDFEEAQEFIEYNTLRAIPYFDTEYKPIIIFKFNEQE